MKPFIALFSYAGIHHQTFDALLAELQSMREKKVKHHLAHVADDALISRSRSKAMSDFLRTDCDVFAMVDHDLQWKPGDLLALLDQAALKRAAVAGFYATRAKRAGYAGRLKQERAQVTIGKDELHEAEFLPGGFTAIPRRVVEAVLASGQDAAKTLNSDVDSDPQHVATLHQRELRECFYFDGTPFWPFFTCLQVPSTLVPGKWEFLSEDWSFSLRATLAGLQPQFLWAKPILAHFGEHPYMMAESTHAAPPSEKVR